MQLHARNYFPLLHKRGNFCPKLQKQSIRMVFKMKSTVWEMKRSGNLLICLVLFYSKILQNWRKKLVFVQYTVRTVNDVGFFLHHMLARLKISKIYACYFDNLFRKITSFRGVINGKADKHLPYTNFEIIRLLSTNITFIWTCLFS